MPLCSSRPQRACARTPGTVRVLLLAALSLLWLLPAARAELPPDVAKKVAKLEKKLEKRLAKQVLHTEKLAEAQAALLDAQLAELDAMLLPEGDELEIKAKNKALKAAAKAIKKWLGKVTKLGKKLVKDEEVIADLMAQIEELDPGHFDDSSDPGGGDPGVGDPGGGDPGGDPGGELDPGASMALRAVDCGDLNGYETTQEGWELLSETESPPDVTLSPAALDTVHVGLYVAAQDLVPFPSSVATIDPDQVGETRLFTSLSLANPTTLTVSGLQPDTDFRVLLELGALGPWGDIVGGQWTLLDSDAPDIDVEASVSGAFVTVARDVRCSTGLLGSTWEADLGGVVPVWVPARSDGTGQVRLRLRSTSGEPIYLASFAVYGHEELPIFYKRTPSGPLQATDLDALGFVVAFNAGDFDAAEEAALEMQDDWLRGVALCHLVGWLDGSRDGRVDRLDDALPALVAARDAGHAGAVWLLSQARSMRRALDHVAAANWNTAKTCPQQGGFGFLNPDCADQTYANVGQSDLKVNVRISLRELTGLIASPSSETPLHDLVAWNNGTLGPERWEPSPFLPRALKQWGVNLTLINPQLSVNPGEPDSVAMNADLVDVFDAFVDLGFAATDFPDELELRLFQAYAESGSHPKDWDSADWDLFTPQQIAASWWGDLVAAPATVPGAAPWANAQRSFLRAYRSACSYWLQERMEGGAFGGGQGDDVELLLLLFPLQLVRQDGADRLLLAGLDESIRYGLEEYWDVAPGYYQGTITDVEHSAEFTTDPFLAARAAFGLTARAALTAVANAREVLDADDPDSAFAGVNSLGRTRFRSFHFTADGPSDNPNLAIDTLLNGRALVPAMALAGRGTISAGHGALADPRAWAAGWRDDALLSSGKPEGFPAPALWPSGALGLDGLWYSETGIPGDVSLWDSGQVTYVLGLLQAGYRGSADADRWEFLLPAVRMFRAVMDWEDAGEPAGAAGSKAWAAKHLREGARFGPAVAALYPDLAGDPTLTSQPDPDQPGTTYVDAELLERMVAWLDTGNSDQGTALAYAVGDVFACELHQTKDAVNLPTIYQVASTYYRNIFPLLTARVLHTDRVFLNINRVLGELEAAWTADLPVEGQPVRPLVRWEGEGLDLAVSCNHRDLAGTAWSAFVHNFKGTTQPVTLRLEEGLAAGDWVLELGPGSTSCDVFQVAPAASIPVTKRGMATSVSFVLDPGLSLVRLVRTGDAPAPAGWDLAVDPPLLEAEGDGGFTASVRVANVGSSAPPASTLQLLVAAVNTDGTLASPATLPFELLLSSVGVSLGSLTGWNVPDTMKTFAIPAGSPIAELLQQGYGLQLRAAVSAASSEGDSLNNVASRCWFLQDVPAAE